MIINNEMIIIVRSPYLYRLKKENDKSKHIKLVNTVHPWLSEYTLIRTLDYPNNYFDFMRMRINSLPTKVADLQLFVINS